MASGWRTELSVGRCLTSGCGWQSEDLENPRVGSAEATQHKREWPDHEVVIDREQSRRVRLRGKGRHA